MSKKVCVVIGIGPKNGASFARKFSAEGYAVALLSRKTELSEKLAAELGDARAYACDVTDADAIAKAFEAVRKDLGEVDVLVYNAGSGTWGNIEVLEADAFERAWRINTMGLFNCAKQIIPAMKARKAGSIVIVGATASLRGKPFTTAFAPAKAAQRSLAQAMARHLGPQGIHVSLIIVDGGIGDAGAADPAAPEQLDPEHIAHAAHFLAEQPRSAWTFELDVRPSQESW
ncbi:MAG: SDR family NAD(P)-dependent oxidoreductase [Deltaproteobacteria bacterium]|nr:SDR family NAD(P)-dependent oxidoreductase [Deltaproteobacteria bacterium]